MSYACESTDVLLLSSFIDTVLKSGFSYLKKRHPVGQRRVAVLRGEIVPVPPIAGVSITAICSDLAFGLGRLRPSEDPGPAGLT